ncbi:phage tail tape measure protein [Clostridioides difficile]|nr:phage tail tape measure protein [Clostridioides difficile]EQH05565.1 putative phage tail tape measure domain protein [Clostridioides difficile DA00196]EQI52735.1 putative phage tail tape measure domain protein [Clostridioides difficile Y270]EQJ92938.1 putative phage tail tape measure domain protein [Clostridioides difficile P50]
MAIIQTSIRIFDGMTPAFRNMTTSLTQQLIVWRDYKVD